MGTKSWYFILCVKIDIMVNKDEAIKIVKEYLNDDKLKIVSYKDMEDKFVFQYECNNKPLFDNAMIQVNKRTKTPSIYMISENLEELKKYKSIKI